MASKSSRIMLPSYIWRHNNVLRVLHAGMQPFTSNKDVRIDLDNTTATLPMSFYNQRPDVVIISGHNLVIAELTCSRKSNMEYWRRNKREKYAHAARAAALAGWKTSLWTLEVGDGGETSASFAPFLRKVIGMPEQCARELELDCGIESAMSSTIISLSKKYLA